METDLENIFALPILKWVYSSNDGELEGTVGSVKTNDVFPQPVSGDYCFTSTSLLSGTQNE